MSKKVLDNAVYNEKQDCFDSSLKPYGTNVGAPAIQVENSVLWKSQHIQKVNHLFEAKHDKLKSSFMNMMRQFEYNNMVYNAKFNFESVIEKIYHFHTDTNKYLFLSMIPTQECNFDFINNFRLNPDMTWELIETNIN